MKNLLYIFVMALAVTSCSVDPIEEPLSADLNETFSRAAEDACASTNVVNIKGTPYAVLNTYVYPEKDVMVVEITSKDWKINSSKLYIGNFKDSPFVDPSNYDETKFTFTETFINGTYTSTFKFKLSDIGPKSCLAAKIQVKNNWGYENAWADGVEVSDELPGAKFVPEFAQNCLQ